MLHIGDVKASLISSISSDALHRRCKVILNNSFRKNNYKSSYNQADTYVFKPIADLRGRLPRK